MASVQPFDDIFKFPGQELSGENAVTIDAAFLEKHPFLTNKALYVDLGFKVTALALSTIDEQDVMSILPLFTTLRSFSLQNVTIQNQQFRGWPTGMETLQLTDCKITRDVAKAWFKSIGKNLLHVKLSRCTLIQVEREESFAELVRHLPDSIRSLSVYDPICSYLRIGDLPPSLEYCHLEAPMDIDRHLIERVASSSVKTLILRLYLNRPYPMEYLSEMKSLEHLRVLNNVDLKGLSLLQSLNLKTLDVYCYSPPAEENLILSLNDDCLVHVLSFLEQDEWLPLSQAHPRFDRLMATYIYPREDIEIHDGFLDGFSKQEKMAIMKSLQEHATSLYVGDYEDFPEEISRFKKLETLYVSDCLSNAGKRAIPNGIKKIEFDVSLVDDNLDWYDDEYGMPEGMSDYEYDEETEQMVEKYRVSELFNRLSNTLTSLTLKEGFDPSDMSALKNLRELKVTKLKGESLLEILRQNKDLERLEVKFYNEHKKEYRWYAYWDHDDFSEDYEPPTRFPLCPLKSLKVLHLTDINCRIELKHSYFPSLEELQVAFDYELEKETKAYILKAVSKFDQIKCLKVEKMSVEWLSSYKNLECLDMCFEVDSLLDMLKVLPKLSKLEQSPSGLDSEKEAELRKFLTDEKRTLRFSRYGLVLP